MPITQGDIPIWFCGTCKYCGPETVDFGSRDCVECRRTHPGCEGFPLMPIESWCWDGELSLRNTYYRMAEQLKAEKKEAP